MDDGTIIRPLNAADDLRTVADIFVSSWRYAYRGILDEGYLAALTPEHWLLALQTEQDRTLVAEAAGRLVGTATYGPARDPGWQGWGEVISIYMLPGYMGRGLGTRLLARAGQKLQDDGLERIYLWALQDNATAMRFYMRNGFVPAETRMMRIGGRDVCACRLIMDSNEDRRRS